MDLILISNLIMKSETSIFIVRHMPIGNVFKHEIDDFIMKSPFSFSIFLIRYSQSGLNLQTILFRVKDFKRIPWWSLTRRFYFHSLIDKRSIENFIHNRTVENSIVLLFFYACRRMLIHFKWFFLSINNTTTKR